MTLWTAIEFYVFIFYLMFLLKFKNMLLCFYLQVNVFSIYGTNMLGLSAIQLLVDI